MAEQIQQGEFRIVDFSVDAELGTTVHFVRDPDAHATVLEDFFIRHGRDYARFNYLGEWHSHPSFPVRPSPEDMNSMKSIVGRGDGIDFAVLMIVRLHWFWRLELSATMFVNGVSPSPTLVST
jgi:hypothetical protein